MNSSCRSPSQTQQPALREAGSQVAGQSRLVTPSPPARPQQRQQRNGEAGTMAAAGMCFETVTFLCKEGIGVIISG